LAFFFPKFIACSFYTIGSPAKPIYVYKNN
jgi:hypothetical protein